MRSRPTSDCAVERRREHQTGMAIIIRGRNKTQKTTIPAKKSHQGGVVLLLILAMAAIGVGYVGYKLALVFGVLS